jgi:predicted O-methyltransferase YrrM
VPGAATFRDALEHLHGVDGWLTEAQALRLWDAATRVPPSGRIVEIGSFRGRSTIVLASASDASVDVVAIDPHGGGDRGPQEITPDSQRGEQDFAAFHANLRNAGVEARVRHLRERSDAAIEQFDSELDVLYVDGAHRYGPARTDIERWGALVSAGGTMLIHDSFNAIGVMLAQLRLLVFSRQWRYRGRSGSLSEYERRELTASDAVSNSLRQLAELPYFLQSVLIKVALVARLRPVARLLGHRDGDWPY